MIVLYSNSNTVEKNISLSYLNIIVTIERYNTMKKTEEKLIEIEEMYRALFERSFDAIYIHDLEGNFLDANPTALRLLGYNKKDIPSINFATLLGEEQMPLAIEALEEVLKTGSQKKSNEFELRRKDGNSIWIETKAFLIYQGKKPHAIQGIARDITERKLAEAEFVKHHEKLEGIVRERTTELTKANEILQEVIAKQEMTQKALRESEKKYRDLVENINDVIYSLDRDGVVTYVSPVVESVYGYNPSYIIGRNFSQFIHKDDRERVIKGVGRSLAGIFEEDSIEFRILTKSGELRWLIASEVAIYDDSGNITGTRGVISDITDRRKAEEALRESEEQYRELVENITEVIYTLDANGIITYVSPVIESMSGYSISELIGKRFTTFIHEEDKKAIIDDFKASLKDIHDHLNDYRFLTKSGEIRWFRSSESTIYENNTPTGVRGVLTDVTERRKSGEQIKASLKEKEMLLMEIHHRVKNNMQIISSLLNLQSRYIKDKSDLDLFKNSQNRVRSMALVHEMLYKSEDLARIDFAKYIKELTDQLFRSYRVNLGSIKITIDVEDIPLGVDMAIPCALIINEIVSNSLKYAFQKKKRGEIKIKFCKNEKGKHALIVSDDGVGLPEGIDISKTGSLGLSLINTLAGQLRGEIKIDRNRGTKFNIVF